MTEHAVVIAGGGPAGMMLAAELALAKIDVAVIERRPNHVLVGSRAGGFHSRTIEVLDQRGVADRFLAAGQVAQVATFAATVLDMSDFPTRHPYSLGDMAEPDRADHGRLDRRAAGADLSRT
jgi:2-polyprenyl-6-methoxyphenol hydroxylase-like FAD-dependent oxidoreductase